MIDVERHSVCVECSVSDLPFSLVIHSCRNLLCLLSWLVPVEGVHNLIVLFLHFFVTLAGGCSENLMRRRLLSQWLADVCASASIPDRPPTSAGVSPIGMHILTLLAHCSLFFITER